jgi:hypothetical protein
MARPERSVPRVALNVHEACEALGVGWDFFHTVIEPELRIVRRGRRKLVGVAESSAGSPRTLSGPCRKGATR